MIQMKGSVTSSEACRLRCIRQEKFGENIIRLVRYHWQLQDRQEIDMKRQVLIQNGSQVWGDADALTDALIADTYPTPTPATQATAVPTAPSPSDAR